MEQFRRSHVTLQLPPAPVVVAKAATFIATHPMRIRAAQLALSDPGGTGGATTVILKKNGVQFATDAALTVAQNAAVNATKANVVGDTAVYPGGERVSPGDVITVDVTAVPTGTAPKAASVIFSVVQVDV